VPRVCSQSSAFLNAPGDRPLVERAAPEQTVRGVCGLDQSRGSLGRFVVLRVVQGQVEASEVEQLRLRTCVGGAVEGHFQSGAALRVLGQRAAQADDGQRLRHRTAVVSQSEARSMRRAIGAARLPKCASAPRLARRRTRFARKAIRPISYSPRRHACRRRAESRHYWVHERGAVRSGPLELLMAVGRQDRSPPLTGGSRSSPMRSTQPPSTSHSPCSLSPSSTKNAVAAARSSTTMPTCSMRWDRHALDGRATGVFDGRDVPRRAQY
jgi:hypothetical protein